MDVPRAERHRGRSVVVPLAYEALQTWPRPLCLVVLLLTRVAALLRATEVELLLAPVHRRGAVAPPRAAWIVE
jgi:hypothetical protein